MQTLHSCASCDGFLPPSATLCPHCGAASTSISASTVPSSLGGKLFAVASGGLMALTLMACYGGPPGECEGTDADGDGYSVGSCDELPDCNDSDASIYPGASDSLGDGVDQNCDGVDGIYGVTTSSSSSGGGSGGGIGGSGGGIGGSGGGTGGSGGGTGGSGGGS